jgi:hypothetical protein
MMVYSRVNQQNNQKIPFFVFIHLRLFQDTINFFFTNVDIRASLRAPRLIQRALKLTII